MDFLPPHCGPIVLHNPQMLSHMFLQLCFKNHGRLGLQFFKPRVYFPVHIHCSCHTIILSLCESVLLLSASCWEGFLLCLLSLAAFMRKTTHRTSMRSLQLLNPNTWQLGRKGHLHFAISHRRGCSLFHTQTQLSLHHEERGRHTFVTCKRKKGCKWWRSTAHALHMIHVRQ